MKHPIQLFKRIESFGLEYLDPDDRKINCFTVAHARASSTLMVEAFLSCKQLNYCLIAYGRIYIRNKTYNCFATLAMTAIWIPAVVSEASMTQEDDWNWMTV